MSEPSEAQKKKAAQGASEAFHGSDDVEGFKKPPWIKRIVIALLILLILAGAGFAAYWWFFMRDTEKKAKKPPPEAEPPRAAEGSTFYAKVPNLMVTVLNDSGPQAIVRIKTQIQVGKESYVEKLENRSHVVQDLLTQSIYGYVNKAYRESGPKLDLEKMRRKMRSAVNERFGANAVQSVQILGVTQRPAKPKEGAG